MLKQPIKKNVDKKPMNSLVYILIYLSLAMLVIIPIDFLMQKEEPVSIANNSAEASYYEGNYENAILEFDKLQENEEWPSYTMQTAKTYSIQGDYIKSNEIIQKVYDIRNKLIDENGIEKYKDKDEELVNDILFTSMINGDEEKALEYGEVFLVDYPKDKKLFNNMFMIYLMNNKVSDAQKTLINYENLDLSSTDLAICARMNILINKYDKGFELLKEAWNKDNNDLTVLDMLYQIYEQDNEKTIEEIKKLSKENSDDIIYDIWLAKIYSLDNKKTSEAQKLLQKIEAKNINNLNIKFLKVAIEQNSGDVRESKAILNNIEKENEETFIEYYAKAIKEYNLGNFESALNDCKRSILLNRDYLANYNTLLPKIMDRLDKGELEQSYLRLAIEKEPYNYNLIIKIADYYSKTLKDSNRALYYYELASKINPKDAEILYNIALININNQRIDDAIEILENSIKINPKESKYSRALGAIYLAQEKNDLAIRKIREAYAKNENDILNLNNAGCYYIIVEKNVSRALTNFKAAYEGIDENTTYEQRQIITENYNRVRALDSKNEIALTLMDFKLFY